MKITVTRRERLVKRGYPYVGEWMGSRTDRKREGQETLVLFTSAGSGMCVKSVNTINRVGHSHCSWVEENFIPFDGVVKIEI